MATLLPTDYKKHNLLKDKINCLDDNVRRKLQRFPYRYRFANAFIGVDADEEIATRTRIGYEAGMKVFLAYTCYEQIVYVAQSLKVLGINSKAFNQVVNNNITTKLLKNKNFMKMINEVYKNGLANDEGNDKNANTQLTNCLANFIADKSADILCLAYAIRNLYAHGEFTGGGAGVTNNSSKALFYEIADEILMYSNQIYSKCLNQIERMR